ncbi:hypothetical protein BKA67DRAFT_294986 [Truncatella angustata]|uniref:Uncharacterized protein n=1 Tax=Truncatella angustata TaxID=152316 RepID=A0A9P8ZX38_9PEZI|nr:uncharacterized protein BKA67DRAFT_294986 [Truncatella angustata]KAH6652609.1 hypothetical protein BKA67DRAFT_294986 [Truncatella angustata]
MSYNDVLCANSQQWVVPPPAQFNTGHDCTLFARYLSLMLRYDVQFNSIERLDHFDRLAHQEHKLCRVPIIATENYIADSLPPSLQPSSCELIAWYYGNGSFCSEASYELSPDSANVWNPYVEKFIYEPRRVCNKELRSALGLAGEPDIAGIGVMISYCIEVLLVTMCLALIVTEKLMQNRPNGKLKSLFSAPITVRLLNAFRGSIQALFSSAMIFSFAMVLATLTTFMYRLDRIEVENRWMNGEDVSLYEPQLLVTASTFSMFPVVVLQFTMQSQLSGMRRRARAALLVVLYVLCSASIVWICISYLQPDWKTPFWFETEPNTQLSDFVYNRYSVYMGALFVLVVAIPASGGIVALLLMLWHRQASWPREQYWWKIPPRYMALWQFLTPMCCFLMMWVSTILLFFLRDGAIKDSGTDSTSEWTVGQILALANWGPVMVEFIFLFCFAPVSGKEENDDGDSCLTCNNSSGPSPAATFKPSGRDTESSFISTRSEETLGFDQPDVFTSPIWQWRYTLCTL